MDQDCAFSPAKGRGKQSFAHNNFITPSTVLSPGLVGLSQSGLAHGFSIIAGLLTAGSEGARITLDQVSEPHPKKAESPV